MKKTTWSIIIRSWEHQGGGRVLHPYSWSRAPSSGARLEQIQEPSSTPTHVNILHEITVEPQMLPSTQRSYHTYGRRPPLSSHWGKFVLVCRSHKCILSLHMCMYLNDLKGWFTKKLKFTKPQIVEVIQVKKIFWEIAQCFVFFVHTITMTVW